MVKAIVTDLDGTILPSRGVISKDTLLRLELLKENNTLRIIATGRTLFAALKVLPEEFPIDYLIFSSGAGIMRWKDKQIIYRQHLDLEETKRIADYLWNLNINFTIQREIPNNHFFYYTDMYPVHPDYIKRLDIFKEFGTLISSSSDIRSESTQLLTILDEKHLKLIDSIRNELSDYSVIRASSPYDYKAIWIEVFPKNINKGESLRHLVKHLNISLSNCAGLGNDYNDIDFLDICGNAYVVSNAPENLKKRYQTVSSDIEEGFSDFLNRLP